MIDKEKLKELIAEDQKVKTERIWRGLGFKNDVTFYYHLKKDPEAKQMFVDAKKAAIGARNGGKASARKPGKKSRKKAAKRAAPPRNARAKNGLSDELLRKIRHEFEHIALYESISDHFEEIRKELNQA